MAKLCGVTPPSLGVSQCVAAPCWNNVCGVCTEPTAKGWLGGWDDRGVDAALLAASLFSVCFFLGMERWHRLNDWIDASRDREEEDVQRKLEESVVAHAEGEAQAHAQPEAGDLET